MKTIFAENVFTVAGLLTPDECEGLIAFGEVNGFEHATVRTYSGPQLRPDIRDNDRSEFADPALAALLWERCRPFVSTELEGGTAVGLDEDFRFYRYDVGQLLKDLEGSSLDVSRATVYRTLSKLVDAGMIRKLEIGTKTFTNTIMATHNTNIWSAKTAAR